MTKKSRGRPAIGARLTVILTPEQLRWLQTITPDGESLSGKVRSLIDWARGRRG